MKTGIATLAIACALCIVAAGCASPPEVAPLAVAPVRFNDRELRDVRNIIIVTDASSSMRKHESFGTAKALAISFIKALPEADARSSNPDYNVGFIAFGGKERIALPLQRFDRSKLLAASERVSLLGSPLGTGGTSPLHEVIESIGDQLADKAGRTSVVIFSDGLANDPERTLAAARAIIHKDPVCFNGVQVGDSEAGASFLRALAETTACGTSRDAASIDSPQSFERYAKNMLVGEAPLPAVAAAPPGSCAGEIRLRGIEFGHDKAKIDAAAVAVLDTAVEAISGCTGAKLRIDGYTDATGPDAYNMKLSERRAAAVRDFFVARGIDAARLTPTGHGKSDPIAPNDSRDGRARNRRVELSAVE
jgi:OmpA-OmpF porin, OOP family